MSHIVNCVKLKKEAEGLARAPYPGEIGKKIFENVSNEAWQMWMKHQTMLINENRLSVIDPKAREYLEEQMLKFLFEDDADMPEAYKPT